MIYEEWISDYCKKNNNILLGKCKEAVKLMCKEFPELRQVTGHVYTSWGKRSHFWCEDPGGEIIDPTAAQFTAVFEYEEWKSGDEVCVGKCMNCGEQIWKSVESLDENVPRKSTCSKICEKELIEYYRNI